MLSIIAVINFAISSSAQVGSNIWLGEWSNDIAVMGKNATINNVTYRLGVFVILGLVQCLKLQFA